MPGERAWFAASHCRHAARSATYTCSRLARTFRFGDVDIADSGKKDAPNYPPRPLHRSATRTVGGAERQHPRHEHVAQAAAHVTRTRGHLRSDRGAPSYE